MENLRIKKIVTSSLSFAFYYQKKRETSDKFGSDRSVLEGFGLLSLFACTAFVYMYFARNRNISFLYL